MYYLSQKRLSFAWIVSGLIFCGILFIHYSLVNSLCYTVRHNGNNLRPTNGLKHTYKNQNSLVATPFISLIIFVKCNKLTVDHAFSTLACNMPTKTKSIDNLMNRAITVCVYGTGYIRITNYFAKNILH